MVKVSSGIRGVGGGGKGGGGAVQKWPVMKFYLNSGEGMNQPRTYMM